jgi:hypothetical protein
MGARGGGQGHSLPLTGYDEYEAETRAADRPYHRETEQEDFLVLSREALLIAEGQERPLKQWDGPWGFYPARRPY